MKSNKTAIIVHGGAIKGSFAAGVMYQLSKAGIQTADIIIGTSSSVPTAAYFTARQFEFIKNIWLNEVGTKDFIRYSNLLAGKPVFNLEHLINVVFQQKYPLKMGDVVGSKSLFLVPLYNYQEGRVEFISNRQEKLKKNFWEILQAALTVHDQHIVRKAGLEQSVQSKVRYLPLKKKVKKHAVNSDFFKKWSPEMAYILGFIAADGNICHSGNAHTLHIASDDIDIIEKIKKVMHYFGPIHQKPRFNQKISYSLRICDKEIFYDLMALGITERKSLNLNPKVLKLYVKDFIRGFLDGDGSVYLRKTRYPSNLNVIFYTASEPMAIFVHNFLKKSLKKLYGGSIRSRLSKFGNPYYSLGLGHKASAKLFKLIYKESSIYMDRKYRKFKEGLKLR